MAAAHRAAADSSDRMPRQLDEDLWVIDRPLRVCGLQIGCRMTVVRLADGSLFLHSPIDPDAETRRALDGLGPVRHVVAPNKVHHLFASAWRDAAPDALLYAAPGLPEKRADVHFDRVLDDDAPDAWDGQIDQALCRGIPYTNEVAFCHRRSRTLLLADLAFNMHYGENLWTRLWLRAMGIYGKFGVGRHVRRLVRDPAALRASLDRILAWDFERIVVAHGVVLQRAGPRVLRQAIAGLGTEGHPE